MKKDSDLFHSYFSELTQDKNKFYLAYEYFLQVSKSVNLQSFQHSKNLELSSNIVNPPDTNQLQSSSITFNSQPTPTNCVTSLPILTNSLSGKKAGRPRKETSTPTGNKSTNICQSINKLGKTPEKNCHDIRDMFQSINSKNNEKQTISTHWISLPIKLLNYMGIKWSNLHLFFQNIVKKTRNNNLFVKYCKISKHIKKYFFHKYHAFIFNNLFTHDKKSNPSTNKLIQEDNTLTKNDESLDFIAENANYTDKSIHTKTNLTQNNNNTFLEYPKSNQNNSPPPENTIPSTTSQLHTHMHECLYQHIENHLNRNQNTHYPPNSMSTHVTSILNHESTHTSMEPEDNFIMNENLCDKYTQENNLHTEEINQDYNNYHMTQPTDLLHTTNNPRKR